jgi:hypothetical protein
MTGMADFDTVTIIVSPERAQYAAARSPKHFPLKQKGAVAVDILDEIEMDIITSSPLPTTL